MLGSGQRECVACVPRGGLGVQQALLLKVHALAKGLRLAPEARLEERRPPERTDPAGRLRFGPPAPERFRIGA